MGRMRDTAATQVVPHLLGKLIRLVADPLNTVRRSHRLAHEIALIPLVAETVEHLHAHFIVRPRQIDVVHFLTIEEILIVGVVGGNIRERCLNIRIVGGTYGQEFIIQVEIVEETSIGQRLVLSVGGEEVEADHACTQFVIVRLQHDNGGI